MNPQLPWFVARATGIVGWALITASVVWGLLLSTRMLRNRPGARWLLDLHRFLGALAVVFTGLHLGALALDHAMPFSPLELFVPFAATWRPGAVAIGIAAFYLLLAVEVTSLLMRRIPRRWWRAIHLTSFGCFWAVTVHGIVAGTDVSDPLLLLGYLVSAALVVFLTVLRTLADRPKRVVGPARAQVAPAPR